MCYKYFMTEAITIDIAPSYARIYRDASESDKEKLQALFEVWMHEYSNSSVESLKHLMDDISDNAQKRGLTPDILDSILCED